MKIQKTIYLKNQSRKKCTLLVPWFIYPEFEKLKSRHGGLKFLLSFLIKKFQSGKGQIFFNKDISSTTGYQENGLSLQREDFRPLESDWVKLKILALSHNLSMCAFFAMMVLLELAGALGEGGVPRITPKITLIQSITPATTVKFKRLLYQKYRNYPQLSA